MTASLSTKKQSAVVFDEAETSAISRWEALAADIATVTQESGNKQFDYRDATGNAQARSWMAKLRKLKGRIEKARKEAKAPYLERGRAVDETAKTLEGAVQGLIDPHERKIEEIEAEERVRIEAHRAVLERISRLAEGITSSAEAQARLVELTAIDLTLLEEFQAAGLNRQAEVGARLKEQWDSLIIQEAERAELEVLRAEKAKRDAADALELKRQLAEIEQPASVASEAGTYSPAPRVYGAGSLYGAGSPKPAAPESASSEPGSQGDHEAQVEKLRQELLFAIAGLNRRGIVDLIISGGLHEAVRVDWSLVEIEEFQF
jgi:hypothetical protein